MSLIVELQDRCELRAPVGRREGKREQFINRFAQFYDHLRSHEPGACGRERQRQREREREIVSKRVVCLNAKNSIV